MFLASCVRGRELAIDLPRDIGLCGSRTCSRLTVDSRAFNKASRFVFRRLTFVMFSFKDPPKNVSFRKNYKKH